MQPAAEQEIQLDADRWSGFRDSFGEREVGIDADGSPIELVRLVREFAPAESALAGRVAALAKADLPCVGRPLRLEHDDQKKRPRLVLVSERVAGVRLSEAMTRGASRSVVPDIGAAMYVLRRLFTMASALEKASRVSHFVIAPERVVITPRAEVVIIEAALAAGAEALAETGTFPKSLKLALSGVGHKKHGVRLEIARIARLGVAMMIGRGIEATETVDALSAVLNEVGDVAAIRAGDAFAASMRGWLEQALTIEAGVSFASFQKAGEALEATQPPKDCAASRDTLRSYLENLQIDDLDQPETLALETDRVRSIRARQTVGRTGAHGWVHSVARELGLPHRDEALQESPAEIAAKPLVAPAGEASEIDMTTALDEIAAPGATTSASGAARIDEPTVFELGSAPKAKTSKAPPPAPPAVSAGEPVKDSVLKAVASRFGFLLREDQKKTPAAPAAPPAPPSTEAAPAVAAPGAVPPVEEPAVAPALRADALVIEHTSMVEPPVVLPADGKVDAALEARAKEDARRLAEAEAQRLAAAAAAEALRNAEETRRLAAEAEARRAEDARRAAETEARRLAEDAAARSAAEAEARRRAEAEAEARRLAEAEAKRLAAEAEARRLAEAEAQRLAAEAEARRLAEAEAKRLAAEAEARRLAEAEAQRLAAEAEARRRAEAEAQRLAAEAEARRLAEAEARRLAEAEARRLAEAEARRLAAEAEARRRAEAEARRLAAEAEARRAAAEAAALRLAAEAEARRAAEARRLAAEAEARRAAEAEARQLAAEAETRRLAAEVDARRAAEAEARRLAAEAQARRAAEEAEARRAAEQAARRAAEEAEEAEDGVEEEVDEEPADASSRESWVKSMAAEMGLKPDASSAPPTPTQAPSWQSATPPSQPAPVYQAPPPQAPTPSWQAPPPAYDAPAASAYGGAPAAPAYTPPPPAQAPEPAWQPAQVADLAAAHAVEVSAAKPATKTKTPSRLPEIVAAASQLMRSAALLVVAAGAVGGIGWFGYSYFVSATKPGVVAIESTPTGAEIFVDGTSQGVTPLTVELSAGSHEVELRRRGASRQITIEVKAGELLKQQIDLTNLRAVGTLVVDSTPAGAKVIVDGRGRGVTPVTISDVVVGAHKVVLESAAGSVTKDVQIQAGATVTINEGIFSGWIAVFGPFELQVYERKRLIGSTQNERIMLPPGRHEIELVNTDRGYRETRTIEVGPGATVPVNVETTEGTVRIDAPEGSEIFIDGTKVGDAPLGTQRVTIGIREILVKHPQLGEKKATATVTSSTPAEVRIEFNNP